MAIFARINDFGEVTNIVSVNNKILLDSGGQESELRGIAFLRTLYKEQTSIWVQGSYNTYGGVHKLGGTPFRMNSPGEGFKYDADRNAFIEPKPYESWVLDEDTCLWEAPIPTPTDPSPNSFQWDEATTNWILVEGPLEEEEE
jgi:hypothetical protein|tara:strand:- start:1512 stop:1940 length:429 start_codon:yes stop_codon:yes gene_type:complete